jgi:ubiquinone/menaquinone biosynthesis C-methylase UbiE
MSNDSANPNEVKSQYSDARNLAARQAIYRFAQHQTPWAQWVLNQLPVPQRARVLDVGCGNGRMWDDGVPGGWELVLSDLSPGMLRDARRALAMNPRRIRFVQCDAVEIPFAEQSFDGVIANHMLYHVPNRRRAIGEMRRVLRPGGTLCAATNGEGHLRELKAFIGGFVSLPTTDGVGAVAPFTLENGQSQLREWFTRVRVVRQQGELRVTDGEAIVNYALSIEGASPVLVGETLDAMRSAARVAVARSGAFVITTDAGVILGAR